MVRKVSKKVNPKLSKSTKTKPKSKPKPKKEPKPKPKPKKVEKSLEGTALPWIELSLEEWSKMLAAALEAMKPTDKFKDEQFGHVLIVIRPKNQLEFVGTNGSLLMRWKTVPLGELSAGHQEAAIRYSLEAESAKRMLQATRDSLRSHPKELGRLHLGGAEFSHPLGTCRVQLKTEYQVKKEEEEEKLLRYKRKNFLKNYEKIAEKTIKADPTWGRLLLSGALLRTMLNVVAAALGKRSSAALKIPDGVSIKCGDSDLSAVYITTSWCSNLEIILMPMHPGSQMKSE